VLGSASVGVGVGVGSIAITPDGRTVYVARDTGQLFPISTATHTAGTPIPAGDYPTAVAIAP